MPNCGCKTSRCGCKPKAKTYTTTLYFSYSGDPHSAHVKSLTYQAPTAGQYLRLKATGHLPVVPSQNLFTIRAAVELAQTLGEIGYRVEASWCSGGSCEPSSLRCLNGRCS